MMALRLPRSTINLKPKGFKMGICWFLSAEFWAVNLPPNWWMVGKSKAHLILWRLPEAIA